MKKIFHPPDPPKKSHFTKIFFPLNTPKKKSFLCSSYVVCMYLKSRVTCHTNHRKKKALCSATVGVVGRVGFQGAMSASGE